MLDWQHLTKLLAVSLALILALAIVAPQPAHAQFSLGGITGAFNLVNQVANNILSFINNTMRPLLEGVQSAGHHPERRVHGDAAAATAAMGRDEHLLPLEKGVDVRVHVSEPRLAEHSTSE